MYLEEAILHLSKDARMSPILQSISLAPLEPSGNVYFDLLNSIVSQQLSVRAAETIFNRFCALFPEAYPTPEKLLNTSVEQLRAIGLSNQKASYLKNVAAFALDNNFDTMPWNNMADEEILNLLTRIKGVGRWTSEMILIFTLAHPDIFPSDDLGIQQAMTRLCGLTSTGKLLHREMVAHADCWRPYRSTASRLLWRWKDLKTSF